MTRLLTALVLVGSCAAGVLLSAQTATPFKLGTFQRQDRTFVGIVAARGAGHRPRRGQQRRAPATPIAAPADMKDLIARYDIGRARPHRADRRGAVGTTRPAYVYDVTALKTLPPIMYPTTMLNAAVNYREHGTEMAARGASGAAAAGAPVRHQRRLVRRCPTRRASPASGSARAGDTRWNPYLFLKPSASVIADGEAIRFRRGRTQIDWECELGVVVGRMATRVPAAQAADYIFGYTLEHDVSDRGGRGDARYDSDWLIAKTHDTFAPLGPFIVPKEFVPDPQKLPVKFTLNGAGDAGREHVADDSRRLRAGRLSARAS